MPIYEYKCSTCQKSFALLLSMNQSPPLNGPECARQECDLVKELSSFSGVVKSKNTFAQAASYLPETKPLPIKQEHVCGSGCVLHNKR